jgi:transcription termination/antitermination protein NusG
MATAGTQMMDKRWYIVHAYSNFEKKVAESIREQSKQRGLEELFEQVLVPTEKVTEVRRGRKIDAERKFFPGYVLVKMKLTDEAFHLIKNTPKVTGFLGAENKPMPISEAEAMRILHQVQEGVERPKASVSFEIGENVRRRRGNRRGALAREGRGVDLRTRHAGRTGIRSGREGLIVMFTSPRVRGEVGSSL